MSSTTEITPRLLKQLSTSFPLYTYQIGDVFKWSPSKKQITYTPNSPNGAWLLLHELGHAQLNHQEYTFDIDLLKLESAAWEQATLTAPGLDITIDQDFIQDCLDDYRAWLHQRSLCPRCNQTGLQTKKNTYSCINCRYSWLVNDARQCGLKRTRLQDRSEQQS